MRWQRHSGHTISLLRSDSGQEFTAAIGYRLSAQATATATHDTDLTDPSGKDQNQHVMKTCHPEALFSPKDLRRMYRIWSLAIGFSTNVLVKSRDSAWVSNQSAAGPSPKAQDDR